MAGKGMGGEEGRGEIEAMRRLCSSAQYTKEFEHAAPGNDAPRSIATTCARFYIYFISKYFRPSIIPIYTYFVTIAFKFDRSKFDSSSRCIRSQVALIANCPATRVVRSANSNNYIRSDADVARSF